MPDQTPAHSRAVLVIGYGNELRADDGLGPKLADLIRDLNLPGVRVSACHQLTPELADPISAADAVVFIDASVGASRDVQVRPLTPASPVQATGHAGDPSALLGLAETVFGRCPPAWWMTVPAFDLSYGYELSVPAKAAMRNALEAFKQLWSQLQESAARRTSYR